MDVKLCDGCGILMFRGIGYQIETIHNNNHHGGSWDLCDTCYKKVEFLIDSIPEVRLISEDITKALPQVPQKPELGNPEKKISGVNWQKGQQAWRILMTIDKRQVYIGQNKDYVEAVALKLAMEQCWGLYKGKPPSEAEVFINNFLLEKQK